MTPPAPPKPDEFVEALFEVLVNPPPGYDYYPPGGQVLFPCYGQDRWRILLHKKGTPVEDSDNLTPVFLEGEFVRKLGKALHALENALKACVKDDIPEITGNVVQ